MIYALLKFIHVLSIIVWVGGMVFAHFCMRPALASLEPAQRLAIMRNVLGRFFRLVAAAVVLVLISGLWMISQEARQAMQAGVDFKMPFAWTAMATLGLVMMALFGHIRFALFKRLTRAADAGDQAAAAAALASIRKWVLVNLILGVLTVAFAVLG